jgi:hypothetical protein
LLASLLLELPPFNGGFFKLLYGIVRFLEVDLGIFIAAFFKIAKLGFLAFVGTLQNIIGRGEQGHYVLVETGIAVAGHDLFEPKVAFGDTVFDVIAQDEVGQVSLVSAECTALYINDEDRDDYTEENKYSCIAQGFAKFHVWKVSRPKCCLKVRHFRAIKPG